ncbi:ABC transporter permease [Bacillaceae bacterium]
MESTQVKNMTKRTRQASLPKLISPVLQTYLWRIAVIASVIVLWELGVSAGIIDGFLFGSPSGILHTFLAMFESGQLFADTSATLLSTIVGFLLGSFIGSIAGLLMWYSKLLARIVDPFVVALNGVPKIALAPMIIIWFGSGIFSKMTLAAISTFIVALLTAYQGTHQIDPSLINLLKSFGAKKSQIFTKVVIPSSLPWIISAFRLNIGFALIAVVSGEFISSAKGLGHMVFVEGNLFNLNAVWVGVFMLMFVALMLYTVVGWISKRLLPWEDGKNSIAQSSVNV